MAGRAHSLAELRKAWSEIPPEERGPAGESFAGGAVLFSDGLKHIARHVDRLLTPAIGFALAAISDVKVWGVPKETVFAEIEGQFPLLVTYLRALMPEDPPIATPPPEAPGGP